MKCFLACIVCIIAIGCGPPLKTWVKQNAPSYTFKEPASGDAELGRQLKDRGFPGVIDCFTGLPKDEVGGKSWSKATLKYTGDVSVKLNLDFGPLIKIQGEVGSQGTAEVALEDMTTTRLDNLRFKPAGACRSDWTSTEQVFSVITRALRAGSISVTDNIGGGGLVDVSYDDIGAEASGKTGRTSTWTGVKIWIAHFVERVTVSEKVYPECDTLVGAGAACILDACSVQILGLDPPPGNLWRGRFSCVGIAPKELLGTLGEFLTIEPDGLPGVTFGIVVSGGPAPVRVNATRWQVK